MISPEIKQKTEMEISLEMEDELSEIQGRIKEADLSGEELQSLLAEEKKSLEKIQKRAKEMLKEREKEEKSEAEAMRKKIAKHFQGGQDLAGKLEILKLKFSKFTEASGDAFSPEQQQKIISGLESCRGIGEVDEMIDKIMIIIEPVIEFKKKNARAFELSQREAFANGSLTGEKFIPIEGTEGILCYGISYNRIHLHLAPMRTLSVVEKIRFMKETMPAAMKKLGEIIKKDAQIELITASSYVVAASQELFRDKIGFTEIGPMKKEFRLQYFGDCEMPVLRAAMTREEFSERYG